MSEKVQHNHKQDIAMAHRLIQGASDAEIVEALGVSQAEIETFRADYERIVRIETWPSEDRSSPAYTTAKADARTVDATE